MDCSERTCLFGRAWGDVADGNDQAHDYSECSSNGVCDRKTGECTCNDGFTGDACRYTACPNGCNGHGTCEYISEIATDSTIQYGSVSDRNYDLWDAKKSRFCKCDPYWSGADCSARMCPMGNDPLTTMTADKIGGNTAEVQEVQTIDIRPALNTDNTGSFVALGGDFTLSYTDAYNQEWTTRPIRVATRITQTAITATTNTAELSIAAPSGGVSTVTDVQRRLEMFELYDTIRIHGTDFNSGAAQVTTIIDIDCTHDLSLAGVTTDEDCTMVVSPAVAAFTAAANKQIFISLVSSDTGEIGVKRMLQELPNQVIPSITVDETIALDSNSYKVTFSDSANSGDQHMLKCKVASCDTDGCQPRKKAIKGLYRSVLTSSGSSSTSSLASAATWATNFQTGAAHVAGQTTVATTRAIDITAVTGTTLTLGAAYMTALTNTQVATVYQIQDFTDDHKGVITGGVKAAAITTFAATNTQAPTDASWVAAAAGQNKLTATVSTDIIVAGDTISVACATATNDGYYKVSKSEATGYTVEGHITANSVDEVCVIKKVAASPCTVTETVKGTSELLTCSRHGNCDSQTGLCACFAGYTGEDCATQTVLV